MRKQAMSRWPLPDTLPAMRMPVACFACTKGEELCIGKMK